MQTILLKVGSSWPGPGTYLSTLSTGSNHRVGKLKPYNSFSKSSTFEHLVKTSWNIHKLLPKVGQTCMAQASEHEAEKLDV